MVSPEARAAALDRVLARAEAMLRPLGEAEMDRRVPPGGRALRDLGFALFRGALGFVDAMDGGGWRDAWLDERAPDDLRDGGAVTRYGALVRARLGGWFEGAGPGEYQRMIDTDAGPRSGRDLLDAALARADRAAHDLAAAIASLGVGPGASATDQSIGRTTRNP